MPHVVTAIERLTLAIGTSHNLSQIYEAALDGIRQALGVERASILLFDPDGVLRFKAWRGISAEYRAAVEGHTPWARGTPAPEPILVRDVREDRSLAPFHDVLAREHIASVAFFPLLSESRVIGKFMLYRDVPAAFGADEISAARTIGALVGFAVERTRSAADAQTQRERVLFALDAANMGTWDWDVASGQVQWSENLERIHGLPPGTFSGEFATYEREIHPEDRQRVITSLRRALESGTPHEAEYRIVAPDGTVRWVLGKGRVEHDGTGRPSHMAGVCMDITGRKRIDEDNARLYEEARKALAQEAAARERITLLTDGSSRLLTSLTPSSVVGEVLGFAQQVIEADAYAVWRRHGDQWRIAASASLGEAFTAQVLPAVASVTFDRPFVARDALAAPLLEARRAALEGEGIHSLMSIPLLVRGDPCGSIVFYYRQPHEPTEVELRVAVALGHLAAAAISNAELYSDQERLRQEAEAATAEQQRLRREAEAAERRAAFLAAASASLSSLDFATNLRKVAQLAVPELCDWCVVDLLEADGTVKRVAMAHADPTQLARAEDVTRRYPPDLNRPHGVGRVLRTGQPELLESVPDAMLVQAARDPEHLRVLRDAGLQSLMIVPLASGDRIFGAIMFVSVTPGRSYTESDLAFATELARRAALAMDNARLYDQAQAANRVKDEFLATLSHELRTPLNVIIGRTQMLTSAPDLPSVRQLAEIIERNGATLRRLVDDLLDISRITLGQVQLDMQRVQLDGLVSTAIQSVQPSAVARGLIIRAEVTPDIPSLPGDPVRLQQVVWNLLTNAVKFTDPGGRIMVSMTHDERDVVLAVTDSGIGIDPAFLPYVFDMFRQSEVIGSRRYGGLGLGLSIVRRLVELHGGEVSAESDGPGRGATFKIRLPHAAVTVTRLSSEAVLRNGRT
jgi:PAS domain S-box-containing protein